MEYRQTDGRMQRSERTRALIVQAHVDLLREGVLKPTAAQISGSLGHGTPPGMGGTPTS